MQKVKVLIIDDSAFVRQTLTGILQSDPGIEVMGTAADPVFAAAKMSKDRPDVITLDLEMPARRVAAHPNVKACLGRVAIERGPLVYCAEGADNHGAVLARTLTGREAFVAEPRPDLLGGIVQLAATGPTDSQPPLKLIPYYAWCHRGPNEMAVWLPLAPEGRPPAATP